MLRVGGVTFVASVLVLLLPLLAPLGGAAKYVVAPALIGACFGLGCVLNGIIDAVKRGN